MVGFAFNPYKKTMPIYLKICMHGVEQRGMKRGIGKRLGE